MNTEQANRIEHTIYDRERLDKLRDQAKSQTKEIQELTAKLKAIESKLQAR